VIPLLVPLRLARRWSAPVNLADHRIRRKQVLSRLACEYYVAA